MAEAVDENQNAHVSVFQRLASFPLVYSAYQIASFAYHDVKNIHPVVEYFCEVSERGVKLTSELATFGVSPLVRVMEPQITAVNNVALQWVDNLEEKLPVLDQPADEVVSELLDNLVSGVRTVKDRALERVQNVLGRTQAMARESYEVVSIAAASLQTLGVRDMVKVAAYFVVSQAEDLVDHFLPDESNTGGAVSSSSSEEVDEMDRARFGLISRSQELVRTIITRSTGKLMPFLNRYRMFLQSGVSLLLTFPSQVRRCVEAVLFVVIPQNASKEVAERKTKVRKKKAEASPGLGRSPGKTQPHLHQGSFLRVAPHSRRLASDTEAVRARARERKRRSFDSSFYPNRIQEDDANTVFYP
ncbi:perilipin-1-like [Pyxicephalus adspersus]|uniref:perilipin-1-like n=1 Tax=Pyxicephalus adspersus TaxID=30357 RepID=UPI003B59B57D